MKEAIKVQSVTITIINGISESFQRVPGVMEEMPTSGAGCRGGKTS